ncbi:ER degradation-enhancing alpha-mannosidase-like protein 1 [Taenia crassiceps]|uniref:alpha-1,2-Mannosidase n=1 Tax=Taenia crassiceps TaxID=6207 RepID=A0ABR4QMR2_9CEST
MFDFGYSSYMKFAYPEDELDPIHCRGRGPDLTDRNNVNVNDALGDYQLTLVDSLDSLANSNGLLRGLLSAHLLITDPQERFGDLRPDDYSDELLKLARNLCDRLLMAFKGTPTGIPFPRIHLGWRSVETLGRVDSCLAGAGTLLLEMGTLSLLLQNPQYATLARNAVLTLWNYRSRDTGLLGTDINIHTGEWINSMSGVGAGQDSFYEYLLKGGILFDDPELIQMFEESLRNFRQGLCGSSSARHFACSEGRPSVYWNIDMFTGEVVNTWVDTLQSAWPGILTLAGELRDAKCQHELHLSIWRRFGLPPERFNLILSRSELAFYPLRPEFAESTYYLYRATKDPVYLRIGAMIVNNLDHYTRVKCGFATIHDVQDMTLEDRMESFFLSETLKYLYLLFDESHPLNVHEEDYIFTTQGHILPISRLRKLARNLPNSPFGNAQLTNHSPSCETNNWKRFL